jgi:hypothetical protein
MVALRFVFRKVPISAVAVPELVVKKPSCNPVRTIASPIGCQIPIIARVLIPAPGNSRHCIVLGLLIDIAPVVGRFALAVFLQMVFVRC